MIEPCCPLTTTPPRQKLVVVSNREPYTLTLDNKTLKIQKALGGLVTALDPVLRETQGVWVCWSGSKSEQTIGFQDLLELARLNDRQVPYEIRGVSLTEKEVTAYYNGFANRQLWPLFHYAPNHCHFEPEDWHYYYIANQKFAHAILEVSQPDDLLWVQDYHLLMVPGMVRQQDPRRNIGFFCHIPFPHYEIFRILPWRSELLRGMLGSDLIGFHLPSYVQDFLTCVDRLMGHEAQVNYEKREIYFENRVIRVGDFPISVDYQEIQDLVSRSVKSAQQLKRGFSTEFIGIGVDRLDYSKGILERLEALELFFERYPQYQKRLTFIQIAVPTRTEIQEYQEMKVQVEKAVGRINGRFSEGDWSPIQYLYRSFPLSVLVSYLMAADFALITPLRDGMNLVAKEYCAAQVDESGVLILSEMAGAAHELSEALLVNPYDRHQVCEAIHDALEMPGPEKSSRMKQLRGQIQAKDIHHWVQRYIQEFQVATQSRNRMTVPL